MCSKVVHIVGIYVQSSSAHSRPMCPLRSAHSRPMSAVK